MPVAVKVVIVSFFLDRLTLLHFLETIGGWFVINDVDGNDCGAWRWIRTLFVFLKWSTLEVAGLIVATRWCSANLMMDINVLTTMT